MREITIDNVFCRVGDAVVIGIIGERMSGRMVTPDCIFKAIVNAVMVGILPDIAELVAESAVYRPYST